MATANLTSYQLAHALIDLKNSGVVPLEMQNSIHNNAVNKIVTIPLNIAGLASTLWTASTNEDAGMSLDSVAETAACIKELADSLYGWLEVEYSFRPNNS